MKMGQTFVEKTFLPLKVFIVENVSVIALLCAKICDTIGFFLISLSMSREVTAELWQFHSNILYANAIDWLEKPDANFRRNRMEMFGELTTKSINLCFFYESNVST